MTYFPFAVKEREQFTKTIRQLLKTLCLLRVLYYAARAGVEGLVTSRGFDSAAPNYRDGV